MARERSFAAKRSGSVWTTGLEYSIALQQRGAGVFGQRGESTVLLCSKEERECLDNRARVQYSFAAKRSGSVWTAGREYSIALQRRGAGVIGQPGESTV